jgi:hypothetical protein
MKSRFLTRNELWTEQIITAVASLICIRKAYGANLVGAEIVMTKIYRCFTQFFRANTGMFP